MANANGCTPQDTAAFKALLEADPECKKCFECGYPHPQWCSYTHGIFICLECSGKHRGIGTHLVCVRSSTMDGWTNWKPEKLKQMELGGNKKARLFFDAHGIPKTPIRARYEHPAAQLYRARLEAEALGQPFNESTFKAQDYSAPPPQPQQARSTGGGGGGRFQGIGSQPQQPASSGDNDFLSALSSGWNTVATATSNAASSAAATVESTTAKVRSDDFKQSVSKNAAEVGESVSTGAVKAWGAMSYFATSLASTVKKSVAGDENEEDGLGGLTRNVQRSDKDFGHMEHQRTSSDDGLRGLTANLGGASTQKYEGLGSDTVSRSPPPATAQRSSPHQRSPTAPTPQPKVQQPEPSQPKGDNDGWDEDW